jgi:hypothetical protein
MLDQGELRPRLWPTTLCSSSFGSSGLVGLNVLGSLAPATEAATGPAPLLLLHTTTERLLRLLGGVGRAASELRDGVSLGPLGAARKQAGAAILFVEAI